MGRGKYCKWIHDCDLYRFLPTLYNPYSSILIVKETLNHPFFFVNILINGDTTLLMKLVCWKTDKAWQLIDFVR